MTRRYVWRELPHQVTEFVEKAVGSALEVASVAGPHTSSFAAIVTTPTGLVFVKAAEEATAPLSARAQTSEIAASTVTGILSPRLLHHGAVDGWRVMVFEHVEGRPVRLCLGSPDMAQVVGVMDRIGRIQPGRSAGLPTLVARLREHLPPARISPLCGNRLLHTDLTSANMIIRPDGRLSVVDWGQVALGPRWAEVGYLGAALLGEGHNLGEVRRWMWRFPDWRRTPLTARRALAEAMIGHTSGRATWWISLVDPPIAG
ncbi:phosphotransferase [Embleya scabrispora]|uniref:phosphotransferase n=1 Tax=Embleya scabrispora TaxID=159449 RepID=UPI0003706ED4|nr:phosphotransferase [Embleya scabrispora]MYS78811.1 phosphotransferase [Streptomyces sp. SID5474]